MDRASLRLEDATLGGKRMRRGQQVVVVLGAANRDPAQFADPDRLNIARKENRQLCFGTGIHACVGQHLARVEAEIAIGTLGRRFGRMELLAERPVWQDGFTGARWSPIDIGGRLSPFFILIAPGSASRPRRSGDKESGSRAPGAS